MCATGTLPVASQIRIARRTETASRHCRQRREKREVRILIVRSSSQIVSMVDARGVPGGIDRGFHDYIEKATPMPVVVAPGRASVLRV